MKLKLDSIANIAIVIFVVIVGGIYVKSALSPATQQTQAETRPRGPQLKVGEQLPTLSGYDWRTHPQTLVLALRNGCHYCEDSAPFYKKLTEMEKSGQIRNFHVVAIFPDSPDVVKTTLQAEGLSLQAIPSTPLLGFKVEGTPTAILADQSGRVIKSWVGELNAGQQQVVLDTLQASAPKI